MLQGSEYAASGAGVPLPACQFIRGDGRRGVVNAIHKQSKERVEEVPRAQGRSPEWYLILPPRPAFRVAASLAQASESHWCTNQQEHSVDRGAVWHLYDATQPRPAMAGLDRIDDAAADRIVVGWRLAVIGNSVYLRNRVRMTWQSSPYHCRVSRRLQVSMSDAAVPLSMSNSRGRSSLGASFDHGNPRRPTDRHASYILFGGSSGDGEREHSAHRLKSGGHNPVYAWVAQRGSDAAGVETSCVSPRFAPATRWELHGFTVVRCCH